MNFYYNYRDFFDIHDIVRRIYTKEDFVQNANEFFNDIGVNFNIISSVSNCLYDSMTPISNYYHTPVHVLAMFQLARDCQIELENYEKLAIFFHDAIYRSDDKENEKNSIKFMNCLINSQPYTPLNDTLWKASLIIGATARHLDEDYVFLPLTEKVMDLDMSGFASSPKQFRIQNDLIAKEYGHLDKATYLRGRLEFMRSLNAKKQIFRTQYFSNSEEIARNNIICEIKELNEQLMCI